MASWRCSLRCTSRIGSGRAGRSARRSAGRSRLDASSAAVDASRLAPDLRRDLLRYLATTSEERARLISELVEGNAGMADILIDLEADEGLRARFDPRVAVAAESAQAVQAGTSRRRSSTESTWWLRVSPCPATRAARGHADAARRSSLARPDGGAFRAQGLPRSRGGCE